MVIVGQDKLLRWIDSLTLDTFPKTLLLEGGWGSGKHTVVKYICDKFNLVSVDMTDKLDFNSINECYLRTTPYMYVIDSSKISIREQNGILKFLEEPLKNAYIIVLAENKYNLLPTILNRCILMSLQPYTKEDLKRIVPDVVNDLALKISDTPGELIKLSGIDLEKEWCYIERVLDSIGKANFNNAFNICSHIGFNGEQDLISPELFIKLLRYILLVGIENKKNYFYALDLIIQLDKDIKIPNINKKYLFEHFIIHLWCAYKGENKYGDEFIKARNTK